MFGRYCVVWPGARPIAERFAEWQNWLISRMGMLTSGGIFIALVVLGWRLSATGQEVLVILDVLVLVGGAIVAYAGVPWWLNEAAESLLPTNATTTVAL